MLTFVAIILGALLLALVAPLIILIVLVTLAGARRRSASHVLSPDTYPIGAPRPAGWTDGEYYPYGAFDQTSSHQHLPHHHGAPTHHTGHMGAASSMGHMGGGMHSGGMHSGGMGGGGGVHGGH